MIPEFLVFCMVSQELIRQLEMAADDAWLSGGGTIVFCAGARRANLAHGLITSAMPWMRPVRMRRDRAEIPSLTMRERSTHIYRLAQS